MTEMTEINEEYSINETLLSCMNITKTDIINIGQQIVTKKKTRYEKPIKNWNDLVTMINFLELVIVSTKENFELQTCFTSQKIIDFYRKDNPNVIFYGISISSIKSGKNRGLYKQKIKKNISNTPMFSEEIIKEKMDEIKNKTLPYIGKHDSWTSIVEMMTFLNLSLSSTEIEYNQQKCPPSKKIVSFYKIVKMI
jgi:hypothetical protein